VTNTSETTPPAGNDEQTGRKGREREKVNPLDLELTQWVKRVDQAQISSQWGEEAYRLIMAIPEPEVRKKRITLLRLADQRLAGLPLVHVFRVPGTGSERVHYAKWLKIPEYKAAYDYLMAEADKERELIEAGEMADAVTALELARRKLHLSSPAAVKALVEALDGRGLLVDRDGVEHWFDDHSTRIRAAQAILDRNPLTAKVTKQELTGADGGPVEIHTAQDELNQRLEALRGKLTTAGEGEGSNE
jgi:hypothetical protein